MRNIVITGGAGFLGAHLTRHHIEQGDHVIVVDDGSSHEHGLLSRAFKALCDHPNCTFVGKDICDNPFADWPLVDRTTGRNIRTNVVYNLACPASPPRYQQIPVKTMMTCTVGTKFVLEHAREHGAIVVHASTSEVYGDPAMSPQKETYRGNVNPYGPRACYDEGKRAAEALCFDYRNQHGVDARLVRIFNTYGPNMDKDDGRVVSNFICQALAGEYITIYGNGKQTRSFCYVDDLIRGLVAMAELKQNPGTPINLGNPNEFTVLDLALKVRERLGGKMGFCDLPTDDPTQRKPDITLAREVLKWEPVIELDEGLDRTIEYFKTVVQPLKGFVMPGQ